MKLVNTVQVSETYQKCKRQTDYHGLPPIILNEDERSENSYNKEKKEREIAQSLPTKVT
jgi:hypothetical protein